MRRLRELMLRFGGLFNKQRKDRELDDEIESHLQMHVDDYLRLGMTPREARRQATLKLGGVESTKEAYRDQRGLPLLETLWKDIHYAARMLRKNPGFTVVAVLTLGLGIGANTAVFSVVETVLLRPLPFANPERLFVVNLRGGPGTLSEGDFEDIRESSGAFAEVAVFGTRYFNLAGGGEPERLIGCQVSRDFFTALGVNPLIGRGFLPAEHEPGGEKVVILNEKLWRQRFGSDETVVGQTLKLDGESYVVAGVMPKAIDFPSETALWVPLPRNPAASRDYTGYFLQMIARLKPGATVEQALTGLSTISSRVAASYPDYRKQWTWTLTPLHEQLAGPIRSTLLVLVVAVGFVVFIACTNVANLLVAHAARRQREFSIRRALGATQFRVLRQILTESFILSGVGGALGLLLAYSSMRVLSRLLPVSISQAGELALNGTVLWMTLAVCFVAGLFFGTAPALAGFLSPEGKLNHRQGAATGRGSTRLQSCLVVSEVALTFVLLAGAGVLIKSFYYLNQVHIGFQPDQVVTARIDLPSKKYSSPQRQLQFQQELLERVQSLPGIQHAGVISILPFSRGRAFSSFSVEGRQESEEMLMAGVRSVGGDYFRAMRIPVIKGRAFEAGDREGSLPVAEINDVMERKYWPTGNAIGQRIKAGNAPWAEIVGVVGSVRSDSLAKEPEPEIFFPFAQSPTSQVNLTILTSYDAAQIGASLRATTRAIDPDQPVFGIQTMRQRLFQSVAEPRLRVILAGSFSALALSLSLIGIYGVISYSVTRRTREIGIRMALGAHRSDVVRLILGSGFKLVTLGLILGLAGTFPLTRLLADFLYQVRPIDPMAFGLVWGLLLLAAMLACYVPARRAMKVDPVVALRSE